MKFRIDAVSNLGCVRQNNEDMAFVFDEKLRDDSLRLLLPVTSDARIATLVADGMGGYGGGEIASEMALESFDSFYTALPAGLDAMEVSVAVKEWAGAVNNDIRTRAASDPELENMGTTLTGIFTYGDDCFLINAGDSRVYRFRGDYLRQLTVDHSERERFNDPNLPSNLIYNALGVANAFVDVSSFNLSFPMVEGDVYVICSDGLSDMISDAEIEAILMAGGTAQTLVDAALAAGGRDNCTVVLLTINP